MNRRDFLRSSLAAAVTAGTPGVASAFRTSAPRCATADAMILVWLPGGIAQQDAWDPKHHTPFRSGMRGRDLLGTCPLIPTSAKGVSFGAGFHHLASVMHLGTVLRSVTGDSPFGDVHLNAQHHLLTARPFASGVRPPSIGASVAHALGRRDRRVPAYVVIGGNGGTVSPEAAFVNGLRGAGYLGPLFAPVEIPGDDFAANCTTARRLVEDGVRFVQVEYPYEAFGGFDAHEYGAARVAEMKRWIDGPIANLVRELDDRGLLRRTLVVVASEFGRTIAGGADVVLRDESQYGFHGHFAAASSMLFFGGPFKRGFAYGRTADQHPMVVVENPVRIEDVHATIYAAMGIGPEAGHVQDGSPIDALLI